MSVLGRERDLIGGVAPSRHSRMTLSATESMPSQREASPTWWDVAVARADLAHTLGPLHAWRHFTARRRHSRVVGPRRLRVSQAFWLAAAAELGATAVELRPGLLEIRLGDAVTRIRGQATSLNDPVSIDVASYKPLACRLLEDAGVPVPQRTVVSSRSAETAHRFLEESDQPCVVKPALGAGGDGVTGGVTTLRQLRQALRWAARFHTQALVERQVPGDAYRLLLLDGVVLDVLRRPRPRITGDGMSTVEELLLAEHEQRVEAEGPGGLKPFVADLDCVLALDAIGLRLKSIPSAGAEVEVRTVSNHNGPRDIQRYSGDLSRHLLEDVRTAVQTLGLRFAGVDVITTDPARSLRDNGGVVLEANAVPGLTYHYLVDGRERGTPVAVPVLRSLLGLP